MAFLKVADTQRSFTLEGKPFFYLADTCWSAFTNITMQDWVYYLNTRREQGFNTLQINILPQWDRSVPDLGILPYALKEDGSFDFTIENDAYFTHAQELCKVAKERGFQLALVVLWSNYVPDTWASKTDSRNIMPYDGIQGYVEKVAAYFDQFEPIYIICGDSDFETEQTISHYKKALEILKQKSPNSLKTVHIRGRLEVIPKTLVEDIDFYMYQSGHNAIHLNMPYHLATVFYENYPQKPIINSEPCYEQMGYSRKMYGRFTQFDIRRAAWLSLVSGASAGICYGAHGIWSWHTAQSIYGTRIGEAFDAPMPWQDAIKFPGAFDYGFMKYICMIHQITQLFPEQLILNDTEEIRIGSTVEQRQYVIYVPSNTTVQLHKVLSDYKFIMYDLHTKNIVYPTVYFEEGKTFIAMHTCKEDVLIIATR